MKKNIGIFMVLSLLMNGLFAQTDYQYSSYMHNQLAINPAFSASSKDLNFSLLGRSQWFGLSNAPQTFTFNAHTLVPKIGGIGLTMSRDQLGSEINTAAKISYAYTVKFGDSTNLSFGLSAGINSRSIDLDRMVFENSEPLLTNGALETKIKPDFGFGIRFMLKKLDIQVATTHITSSFDSYDYNSIPRHIYAMASYNFRLSNNLTLTPSVFYKTNNVFYKVDANLNALIQNRFMVGAGYRFGEAVLVSAGMKITDNIGFLYSYDFVTGSSNTLSRSNHEIVLIAKFNGFNKRLGRVDSKSSF